jgi:ABC-type uncharacterized transport system substrate-binding protein
VLPKRRLRRFQLSSRLGTDPRVGLVASLNRPGGNATGISVFTARLGSKRLGLLHEMVPSASPIAILVNPTNPDTEDEANDIQEAAQGLGVQVFVVRASKADDLDGAFTTLVQHQARAVIVGSDTFFTSQRSQIYQPAQPNFSARRPSMAAHHVGHPHRSRGRWADVLRSQYS